MKQGCVSHSSTEAEIVALDDLVRTELRPLSRLWGDVYRTFRTATDASEKDDRAKHKELTKWDTRLPHTDVQITDRKREIMSFSNRLSILFLEPCPWVTQRQSFVCLRITMQLSSNSENKEHRF